MLCIGIGTVDNIEIEVPFVRGEGIRQQDILQFVGKKPLIAVEKIERLEVSLSECEAMSSYVFSRAAMLPGAMQGFFNEKWLARYGFSSLLQPLDILNEIFCNRYTERMFFRDRNAPHYLECLPCAT